MVSRTTCVLLLTACSATPRTEVLIVIDSDLDVPSAIDALEVEVTEEDGSAELATASLGGSEPPLPRTVGVLPRNGDLGPYTAVATGLLDGMEVVRRQARFSFMKEQTLVLTMHLVRACLTETCDPSETCTETGCASPERSDLPTWTGDPPGLVEAPSDGGLGDSGACVDELCNAADDDCDGTIDETFDLLGDEMNCGACARQCIFRNGAGLCNAGECSITSCDDGFDDCDGDAANGCETNLETSNMHCNACGNECDGRASNCCNGRCQRSAC